jgi:hypothetical protein
MASRCDDQAVRIPPRTATDAYLARTGKELDIAFDVDLGELIQGHHVVARGIMFGHSDNEESWTDTELHYEFVPAIGPDAQGFGWYWMVYASDDAGTEYSDNNGGAFDAEGTGPASHGTRDLGGLIPPGATRLTLRFEPPDDWTPPEPWRRELPIDLRRKCLID